MSFWDVLCICAILHSSPSFYKCVECALVVKPQNVAAVSGEKVVLSCASDLGENKITWSTLDPGSSDRKYIYNAKILANIVSSYISVPDTNNGSCNLHIIASVTAAKRYICIDSSGEEASAELIILENHPKCNWDSKTLIAICSATFAGNWAPRLECTQGYEADGKKVLGGLKGNKVDVLKKNVMTSTWTHTGKNAEYEIHCSAKFEESERPKETSALNIPNYSYAALVYHYTQEPATGTTSVGCIVSIVLNVLMLITLVLILLFVWIKRIKKRHEAKKRTNEEIRIHGSCVSEA